jgi:serine/threonine protein kinase
MIGKTISHYKILEKIGEGGMGVVYKAEDTKLKRTVALKFLSSQVIGSEEEKKRFIHEAQAAAALHHPNICTVFEIDEAEGQTFIAMAYLDGQSLKEKTEAKPLKFDEAVDIAMQVADGLHEAHGNGIVHRDIKSSNVMVTTKGQAILMDFGLAKQAGKTMLTKEGTSMGTVAYMSPEQADGEKVDLRTDFWSFGVMLYEMVTGQLPFKGDYEQAVVYSIMNEDAEPMTGLRTGVPMELERIANKAMAKNPAERYQNANDMLIDLRSAAKELEVETSKTRVTTKARLEKEAGVSFFKDLTSKSKKLAIGISAAVIVAGVFGVLRFFPSGGAELVENRVAVAFFENETGDDSFDYLERMIADDLTQNLGVITTMEIAPLVSAEQYKNLKEIDRLKELSSISQARIIISGSIYMQGEELVLQPRITDISSGERLSTLTDISGPRNDVSNMIATLRSKIMSGIAIISFIPVTVAEISNVIPYLPVFEAALSYMEGARLMPDFENQIESIEFYNRAMEIDSGFVEPLNSISIVYRGAGRYAEADSVLRIAEGKRQQFSEDSRKTLKWTRAWLDGDLSGVLAAQRDRTEINPISNSYDLSDFFDLGDAARKVNNLDEAEEAYSRVDKKSEYARNWEPFWTQYCEILHIMGKHEEELALALEQKSIFGESPLGLFWELSARISLGQIEQVKDLIDGFYTLSGNPSIPGMHFRRIGEELYVHGYPAEAREINDMAIKWFLSRSEDEFRSLRNQFFQASYLALFVYGEDDRSPLDPEKENVAIAIGQTRDARIKDLQRIINDLESENPENLELKSYKGMLAAQAGDRETALQMYDWLEKVEQPYIWGENKWRQAMIAGALGEKSRAVTLLQDAFRNGTIYGVHYHRWWEFFPLHGFPEFEEFIKPKR